MPPLASLITLVRFPSRWVAYYRIWKLAVKNWSFCNIHVMASELQKPSWKLLKKYSIKIFMNGKQNWIDLYEKNILAHLSQMFHRDFLIEFVWYLYTCLFSIKTFSLVISYTFNWHSQLAENILIIQMIVSTHVSSFICKEIVKVSWNRWQILSQKFYLSKKKLEFVFRLSHDVRIRAQ